MKKFISIVLALVIAFSFANIAYASSDFKPFDDSQWFEYGDYDIHYRIASANRDVLWQTRCSSAGEMPVGNMKAIKSLT